MNLQVLTINTRLLAELRSKLTAVCVIALSAWLLSGCMPGMTRGYDESSLASSAQVTDQINALPSKYAVIAIYVTSGYQKNDDDEWVDFGFEGSEGWLASRFGQLGDDTPAVTFNSYGGTIIWAVVPRGDYVLGDLAVNVNGRSFAFDMPMRGEGVVGIKAKRARRTYFAGAYELLTSDSGFGLVPLTGDIAKVRNERYVWDTLLEVFEDTQYEKVLKNRIRQLKRKK